MITLHAEADMLDTKLNCHLPVLKNKYLFPNVIPRSTNEHYKLTSIFIIFSVHHKHSIHYHSDVFRKSNRNKAAMHPI